MRSCSCCCCSSSVISADSTLGPKPPACELVPFAVVLSLAVRFPLDVRFFLLLSPRLLRPRLVTSFPSPLLLVWLLDLLLLDLLPRISASLVELSRSAVYLLALPRLPSPRRSLATLNATPSSTSAVSSTHWRQWGCAPSALATEAPLPAPAAATAAAAVRPCRLPSATPPPT